jgi:hypothetical protein
MRHTPINRWILGFPAVASSYDLEAVCRQMQPEEWSELSLCNSV